MLNLALHSAKNRWFSLTLAIFAIALGVALFLGIERVRESARDSFEASINGVDMVVGARGGDVQILLYSVFNIGNASANISADSMNAIAAMDRVEWVAPISLGDSHRGYRVVGTTNAYFDNVKTNGGQDLTFRQGSTFDGIFGAVIGATVARELGYDLDQSMIVSHGLVSAGTAEHDNLPFYVAGILQPTGTPIDRNVYITIEGMEAIHLDWRNGAKIPGKTVTLADLEGLDLSPKSVTALMVGVTSKRRVFQVQREINEFDGEPLTAILPGVALSNLWAVMGAVEQSFSFISVSALVVSLLGMVALLNMSLSVRRREMAIYRALGARPWQVASFLVIEALGIALVAIALGTGLTLLVQGAVAQFALDYTSVSLRFGGFGLAELRALGLILVATVAASLVPAVRLYWQSLANGLDVTE